MDRFLAFDQLELLLDELENIELEFGVYKVIAESVTPLEQLRQAVEMAKSDPARQAEMRKRYQSLRDQLREMAAHFLIEDTKQVPPTSGQTN